MKTNVSMLFYMKKPKNYKNGPAPIYLRITVEGKRAEITTGRECEPARWSNKIGRANGTKEEIRSFNAFLDNLQAKVYEAHRTLFEKGELITADAIKNILTGKDSKAHMLLEIFADHNGKMKELIGREFSVGTHERYETSLKHTREFLEYRYGLKDIDIQKIDNAFISEYDFYLRSARRCANNSAVKYINNFGKIIRICLSNGWIVADPFANYKGKLKKVLFYWSSTFFSYACHEVLDEVTFHMVYLFIWAINLLCYTGFGLIFFYYDPKKNRR